MFTGLGNYEPTGELCFAWLLCLLSPDWPKILQLLRKDKDNLFYETLTDFLTTNFFMLGFKSKTK
jgi:hypothetical protein